jgi:hypothetical protein
MDKIAKPMKNRLLKLLQFSGYLIQLKVWQAIRGEQKLKSEKPVWLIRTSKSTESVKRHKKATVPVCSFSQYSCIIF